ncbi:MAG: barstar family protein [Phycisphaerales bacterium]
MNGASELPLASGEPHIRFVADSHPEDFAGDLRVRNRHDGVIVIRGWKCQTKEACMNEMGAALQIPGYFGENWDALDECISDLSWLPAARYVLFLAEIQRAFPEDDASLRTLLSVLSRAATIWAQRGIAFHVLVCGSAEGILRARTLMPESGETHG